MYAISVRSDFGTKSSPRQIGEHFKTGVSHLTPESRLSSSIPGMDSLKLLDMVIYLENHFDIEFEDSKLANIKTVRNLVDYIDSLLDGRPQVSGGEKLKLELE